VKYNLVCTVRSTSSAQRLNRELIATRWDGRGDSWGAGSAGSASRAQEWDFDFPPTLVAKFRTMDRTDQGVPPAATTAAREISLVRVRARTADTNSWTKLQRLRRVHHYRLEHVSRCLGSAALRGGTDDGSILRLIRGD
jgi:hypothetical protein